jgi:hypothetical protein
MTAVSAGQHSVRWNGRDEFYRETPSGVYLIRLLTPGINEIRRITLVK